MTSSNSSVNSIYNILSQVSNTKISLGSWQGCGITTAQLVEVHKQLKALSDILDRDNTPDHSDVESVATIEAPGRRERLEALLEVTRQEIQDLELERLAASRSRQTELNKRYTSLLSVEARVVRTLRRL